MTQIIRIFTDEILLKNLYRNHLFYLEVCLPHGREADDRKFYTFSFPLLSEEPDRIIQKA
jgi:hypothetical protein